MTNVIDRAKRWEFDRIAIYSVFSLWFVLRIIHIVWRNSFSTDDGYFLSFAQSIVNGHLNLPLWNGWLRVSEYHFLQGIIQGPIIALFLKVFGSSNWYWSAKLPSLLEATIVLCFIIWWVWKAWGLFDKLILFLIVAFEPLFGMYASSLRVEVALTLFYTISILLLHRHIANQRGSDAFLAGVLGGLAILTFMPGLAILPTAGFVFLFCSNDVKSFIKSVTLFGVGIALVCLPYFGWIGIDATRREIFMLQMGFAKTASASNGGIIISLKSLVGRFALTVSCTFLYYGRSIGSWIILTAILFSLRYIKTKDYRFWFIVLAVGLLALSRAHSVNPRRVLVLLPAATLFFISILRTKPREGLIYTFLSALILSLWLLYLRIAGLNPINGAIIGLFGILIFTTGLLSYRWITKREIAYMKQLFAVSLALIGAIYMTHSIVVMTSNKGFYNHSKNLTTMRYEMEKRFANKQYRILCDSPLFPLFPKNCQIYAVDLLCFPNYYGYWKTYEEAVSELNPDAIVMSESKQKYWMKEEIAKNYLNRNFQLDNVLRIEDYDFYIFSEQ